MKHSLSDSCILILGHSEHPLPELVNVLLDLAWTELFACLKSDINVLMESVLENFVDVLSVSANVNKFLFALSVVVEGYFLLILLSLGHFEVWNESYYMGKSIRVFKLVGLILLLTKTLFNSE